MVLSTIRTVVLPYVGIPHTCTPVPSLYVCATYRLYNGSVTEWGIQLYVPRLWVAGRTAPSVTKGMAMTTCKHDFSRITGDTVTCLDCGHTRPYAPLWTREQYATRLHSALVWADTCPGDMLLSAQTRLDSLRRRIRRDGFNPEELVHYSQELGGWRITPEGGASYSVGASETWFYVGSTDTHAAHARVQDGSPMARIVSRAGYFRTIHGIWDGNSEESTIYAFPRMSDSAAQRIAYALTILTGNDCVLVVRAVNSGEDSPMVSARAYRVSVEWRNDGNRSLIDSQSSEGYAYVRNVRGGNVAYLVHSDNSVTTVEGI